MILYDYVQLLTEIGPGAMSEKQLETIKNSKLSNYYFDEHKTDKKLFENKHQDTSKEAIIVDIDNTSADFFLADDYRVTIDMNPDDENSHEAKFAKNESLKQLVGSEPTATAELFSAVKACVGYFIIYNKFEDIVFNFKAAKEHQSAYKEFWKDKKVPSAIKKDMNKLETMYPEYYKALLAVQNKIERYANIRNKMYQKTIRHLGGMILHTDSKKDYVYVTFKMPQTFTQEVKEYYESI